jgi:CRISPR system Cascade subunit CasE
MSGDAYCLSRISPVREAFEHKDWVAIGGLDPYGQHKLLWQLFDLPRTSSPEQTAFLFRSELSDGLPLFYVLSRVAPHDTSGKWLIDPREYRPDLRAGDRLAFKLRANPVSLAKKEREPSEAESWRKNREKNGLSVRDVTRKRIRHDVVMDAKQRMGWKDLPPDERPSLAHVAYEAGSCWIREKEARMGCQIEPGRLHVDGHFVHCLKGRRDEKGNCRGIALSTLDFEGELSVTDPEIFLPALLNGIGPAKAFGCGLLLVRRLE